MSSAICFNLNQSELLLAGNGLKVLNSLLPTDFKNCSNSKYLHFADNKFDSET